MTFEEYLTSKKIDSKAFEQLLPADYVEWHRTFIEMHPNSFTAQKLFLINKIRRQFPLKAAEEKPAPAAAPAARPKPIMRPKIN